MAFIKKTVQNLLIFVLFSGALLVTYTNITSVSAEQLKNWWIDQDYLSYEKTINVTDEEVFVRQFYLEKKALPIVSKETFHQEKEPLIVRHDETVPLSSLPVKEVLATGYTAGAESTGKTEGHPQFGITFSGVKVKRDLYSTIAADPKVFPIGTILYIPDYGYGVVADTGSAIKGNKIDLYFETVDDVYRKWGKKSVEVFLVEKGDGYLTDDDLFQLNEAEQVQGFREQFSMDHAS